MAVMMGSLYAALIKAGADESHAQRAAEEVAGYEDRIGQLRTSMADLQGEMNLLRWMVGFNIALTLAIAGKIFIPH